MQAANQDRATLRFETPPGRQMQIYFGEKRIEVARDRTKAFVFVATLGYLRRTDVQVFPAMEQRHWLEGLEGALHHFGGVPETGLVDKARSVFDLTEKKRQEAPTMPPFNTDSHSIIENVVGRSKSLRIAASALVAPPSGAGRSALLRLTRSASQIASFERTLI